MDISEILPLFLLMQVLPALTGGGGQGHLASDNTVVLPVAIGHLTVQAGPSAAVLPVGVERDRRGNGRDRRNRPGGGGRRMADQIGPMIFGPGAQAGMQTFPGPPQFVPFGY